MRSRIAKGSSYQVLVLFCQKEFKGKLNSARFIKAKVHSQGGECELTKREREGERVYQSLTNMADYDLFVLHGGWVGEHGADIA